MTLQFPKWAKCLFQPARYKVLYGGRGGGKSWAVARALLLQAAQQPLRVLCTREVQKSIKDSVHRLLSDQIAAMGLETFYTVLETEIRGKNGSVFLFSGLLQHTIDSIKSFEGVDRVWVEEAHSVSKKSWGVLTPTIRRPGSEIWATFNPQLDTDEVFARFVATERDDVIKLKVNYSENPWFPAVLEAERLQAQKALKPTEYAHIWEGECMPAVEGAIYFDQIAAASSRIAGIPHDPNLKTHAVWDLGFNDSMVVILCQRVASELRIIHYIEGNQRTLSDYSAELKALTLDGSPINWGHHYLPHDGFAKRHQTGKQDAEVLTGLGWKVRPVPNMDIEQGIKRARDVFGRMYFNRERTTRLVECLKRYRRHIPQSTNEPASPVHDEYSHGADAFRYLALVADQMSNDEWGGALRYPKLGNA